MLLSALGAAAVLVVVAIVVSSGSDGDNASSRPAVAQKTAGAIPGEKESAAMLDGIAQRGLVLGNPDAPVKLVEFADLQCPICRAHVLQVLPLLVRDYVRPGKASIELRLLSFIGPDSVTAGRAAVAASRQDKLWNFADVFYYNQGKENAGYVTPDFLKRIYQAAGVDAAQASAYAATSASEGPLDAADELADRYGVEGTPTFLAGKAGGPLTKVDDLRIDGLRSAIDGLMG